MQFKELELKPKGSWISRTLKSSNFRRSLTAIAIGAVVGLAMFYFTEGRLMDSISAHEILKSMALGGFFGFFITNSPCARGRC